MTKETLDKFFKMYSKDDKFKLELEKFLAKHPEYKDMLVKEEPKEVKVKKEKKK